MKTEQVKRGRYYFVLSAVVLVTFMCLVAICGPQRAEAAGSQTLEQYKAWMLEAKKLYPYPQSMDKMYRVMICESGGNAQASGGKGRWLGLFQYAPSTWRGKWNPYRNSSIWDAKSQIFATAKAWSIGMQRQWTCFRKTGGQ